VRPTVSVIVAGGTPGERGRFSQALERQTLSPAEVEVLAAPAGVPIGTAWNEAGRRAEGEVLVFTRADFIPTLDFAETLLSLQQRAPGTVALGRVARDPGRSPLTRYAAEAWESDRLAGFPPDGVPPLAALGAPLAVGRDRFMELEGFGRGLAWGEEIELVVRLVGRGDRLARMHAEIVAAGPRVLGSAPYTWTTDGPEAVDAYFGLVDADGNAVDATAATLAGLYGVEPPAWARVAGPTEEQRDVPTTLSGLMDAAVREAVRAGDQDEESVQAEVLAQTQAAASEYGVVDDDGSSDGAWAVAQLIGWARALSSVRRDDARLFPGLHEALPLLDGMARWSAVEPSADDTARSFVASVLRRDLENAARASPD
jgi:hypothetical protein